MTKKIKTKQENNNVVITSIKSVKLSKELLSAETRIHTANKGFITIGECLELIHTGEMYRERNFNSFEVYANEIFDFTRDYAYKIMKAYKVVKILKDNGIKTLPKTESQARPLTVWVTVPEDENCDHNKIVECWTKCLTVNKGKVTAKIVTQVVNEMTGKLTLPTPAELNKAKAKEAQEKAKKGSHEGAQGAVTVDTGDMVGKGTGDGIPTIETASPDVLRKNLEYAGLRIKELEDKVKKADVVRSRLALEVYRAGIKALMAGADEKKQAELIELSKTLLG